MLRRIETREPALGRPVRTFLVLVGLALAVAFGLRHLERTRPQDLPWTTLRIDQPPGYFTRQKLARLGRDPDACAAALRQAGVAFSPVPDRPPVDGCGWTGAVSLEGPGLAPSPVTVACPLAVATALWRRHAVEPAAAAHLGTRVRALSHYGAYSCRRLYGRPTGAFSEHATANAFDVSGFELADGRRVTLARDWNGDPDEAAFLRAARDGACRVFGTALGPDYNAAHADHFHLDMASRGGFGVCR